MQPIVGLAVAMLDVVEDGAGAMLLESRTPPLVQTIVGRVSQWPQVRALALGGSHGTARADALSDLDFYVYIDAEVPLDLRAALAQEFAERMEINNSFWGPGDEWIDAATGRTVDLMYWSPEWIDGQLERVLVRHEPSVGYSTCFWHTVQNTQPLYDRDGWFARLQAWAMQPYPEPLRRAIVANNHPLLRTTIGSFLHQIELAFTRGDIVSVQHRTTALLASYFDVLFAVNAVPHPGEKRLVTWVKTRCTTIPQQMEAQIQAILDVPLRPEHGSQLIERIHALLDQLDIVLRAEGLIER